ncbi:MAG: IclR family transcriptional regulator [Solirubrobacteraceae bacterium]
MAEFEPYHVTRTMHTLELLAERPLTQAELADALQIHRRTARRLLAPLVTAGYATRIGERRPRYAATLKLVGLAGAVVERADLVQLAYPHVVQLRDLTGEAAHLCVPRDDGVMHLVEESGESVVTVKPAIGQIVPYHCTAVGKALLAHRVGSLKRVFEAGLPRHTPYTLVEPAGLLFDLTTVRARGYAVDDRENDLELRCVAAPVMDSHGQAVSAVGVSAPASRMGAEDVPKVAETVIAVASRLSRALGHEEHRSQESLVA